MTNHNAAHFSKIQKSQQSQKDEEGPSQNMNSQKPAPQSLCAVNFWGLTFENFHQLQNGEGGRFKSSFLFFVFCFLFFVFLFSQQSSAVNLHTVQMNSELTLKGKKNSRNGVRWPPSKWREFWGLGLRGGALG